MLMKPLINVMPVRTTNGDGIFHLVGNTNLKPESRFYILDINEFFFRKKHRLQRDALLASK